MTPTTITIEHKLIQQKLSQLSIATASDLTAIGVIDHHTRKFRWQTVVGGISSRTGKIRQHVQLGLIGEALRTGSFVQFYHKEPYTKQADEAIMLTEKLYHAAAWPIAAGDGSYLVAILIGKRQQGVYEPEQIQAGTMLVQELVEECKAAKHHIN